MPRLIFSLFPHFSALTHAQRTGLCMRHHSSGGGEGGNLKYRMPANTNLFPKLKLVVDA